MPQPLRRAGRPSKQLLWIWFRRDMATSACFEQGLDVACATMANRRYFQTKTYTGVDLDLERLEAGVAEYPDAKTVHSSIEEMPSSLKGDFVVCTQTIGINKWFKSDMTLDCIGKLIEATSPGGTLLFNVGPRSAAYVGDIDANLGKSFRSVRKRTYGAFDATTKNGLKSLSIAFAMLLFPPLRRNPTSPYNYYYCTDRKIS